MNVRSSLTSLPTREHLADLEPEALRGPAEVGLEHLTDVHARRHAERIQHDVDGRTVGRVRHVLHRHDRRDHALVAVPAGHLVARLHAALHGEVDLDHLEHAGREIVAGRDLLLLLVEALVEQRLLRAQPLGGLLEGRVGLVGLHADLEPLLARQLVEIRLRDLRARREPIRAARRDLADQRLLDALSRCRPRGCAAGRRDPCAPSRAPDFSIDKRAAVLLDAVAREHAHVDDGAVHAGRHAQARVLHVGRLLAEDRAQQLLFRRQLRLALRRDLADEDVAGA